MDNKLSCYDCLHCEMMAIVVMVNRNNYELNT